MAPPESTELVPLPGGVFRMGSDRHYPEEAPVRRVTVQPFAIERHPVTVAQFARFVELTGYLTLAERAPDPALYPGADPRLLVPGGLVFTPTAGPVPLDRWDLWWRWQPGATWRTPEGPGSDVAGREQHPVVLVAYADALAYARWAGRDLPTEAEAEYAARAGREGAEFAWGDEPRPDGQLMANTWQGRFPHENTGARGWVGTSPVKTFPPNDFGLFDMIGNVWEWTSTYYSVGTRACCAPAVDPADASRAPGEIRPRRVLKGGSHLCAPEYCLRYRPAARIAQEVDSATSHIGFRCVSRG